MLRLSVVAIIATFFEKNWKRISQVSTGLFTVVAINWVFNYPLWLLAIGVMGNLWGSAVMMMLAIPLNRAMLYFHGITEDDWLGMEQAEAFIQKRIDRLCKKFPFLEVSHTKRRVFIFLYLSIFQDSFWAFAYLRTSQGERQKQARFSMRDWMVFLFSTALSCLYWAIRQIALWEVTKIAWRAING